MVNAWTLAKAGHALGASLASELKGWATGMSGNIVEDLPKAVEKLAEFKARPDDYDRLLNASSILLGVGQERLDALIKGNTPQGAPLLAAKVFNSAPHFYDGNIGAFQSKAKLSKVCIDIVEALQDCGIGDIYAMTEEGGANKIANWAAVEKAENQYQDAAKAIFDSLLEQGVIITKGKGAKAYLSINDKKNVNNAVIKEKVNEAIQKADLEADTKQSGSFVDKEAKRKLNRSGSSHSIGD